MKYAQIIKEIGRGAKGARPIETQQAELLFAAILDGIVPDMELGAILLSLRVKGEDLGEMTGFKAAMDSRCRQIVVPPGPRCVVLPTYNGARKQANLMPVVAQLLARQGIPVLIQGRHDFDSRVSPFELLAALDVPVCATMSEAAQRLQNTRIACLPLEALCPGMDRLLALRPRLGVRNSGHTLAKLLDPAPGRTVRVVAVTHPEYLSLMEAFLVQEGATALLMRGTEGEAYASPRRRPRLLGFQRGVAVELFEQVSLEAEAIASDECSVENNAATVRAMLDGSMAIPQPILDQVAALTTLANS
ncbi:DNA-binding protein YbiB [Uliginosibacterium sp. H3]|uniref:DNA-binding protein YbiB n=1 Tax=Uliginosibacterium silvisoli TaxID=3114758 RepID=A0ABU6K7A0_9RHOO|nr:DNA-binding protein YbiB [Uliginosibacterium sp. H3]